MELQSETFKILAVDDNQDGLDLLTQVLEIDNWKVVKASSSKKALKILDTEKIDLVLLDVQLPDLDGYKTAKKIRAQPNTQYIPILFVTATYKTRATQAKGYEAGVQDYLFKPFKIEIARAKVKAWLHLSDLKKGLEKDRSLSIKFQELIKYSGQPICLIDTTLCRFEYVNLLFEEALGYQFDELKGKSFFSYLHDWEQKSVKQSNESDTDIDKVVIRKIKSEFRCSDQSLQTIEWTIVEKHGKWLCTGKVIGNAMFKTIPCLQ